MMKKLFNSGRLFLFTWIFCLQIAPVYTALAKSPDSLSTEIKAGLNNQVILSELYFPLSVKRFYIKNGFKPAWVKAQSETGGTWQAMMLIDCVLQFGLSHNDYHPKELTYDLLHEIFEKPEKISASQKARFELQLTDAMITLMNHLHYGKLNPEFSRLMIDKGELANFNTEVLLVKALANTDNYAFLGSVAAVQPKSKEYTAMQYQMHLLEGQLQEDCYEIPEAEVRKLAINMERLRWAGIDEGAFIQINIPSYTLKLNLPDSVYRFKVVVGSPAAPTPTLQTAIECVSTASGLVYFHFQNPAGVYLCSTIEQSPFKVKERDLSSWCIKVEKAEKLATLLLKQDGSAVKIALLHKNISQNNKQDYYLKKPIPIKITYLTCEVKNGEYITYDDIYKLDRNLEAAFYGVKEGLTTQIINHH